MKSLSTISKSAVTYPAITVAVITGLAVGLGPATCQADYVTTVLADGPLAYYRLNESFEATTAVNIGTAGVAIDGSYVHTNMETAGPGAEGPRPSTYPGFESGNSALQARVSLTNRARVQVTDFEENPLDITGALTLEAWVYRDPQDSANDREGIIHKYASSGRSYGLYYDSTNSQIGFNINPTGVSTDAVEINTGVDIPLGSVSGWNHLVAVFEPEVRLEVYLNGQSVGINNTGVIPASINNGGAPFYIGAGFTNTDPRGFEGRIDEVAVYNVALSAERILAHYEAAFTEIQSLTGDYNDDGAVNAADYVVWRNNYEGDPSALANRDTANVGPVSIDDYISWKNHYGQTSGGPQGLNSPAKVPEPSSAIVLLMGLAAAGGAAARRRRAALEL